MTFPHKFRRPKLPGEVRRYRVRGDKALEGLTPTSLAVTPNPDCDAGVTIDQAAMSGNDVVFRASGGNPGETAGILISITTADFQTLKDCVLMDIAGPCC